MPSKPPRGSNWERNRKKRRQQMFRAQTRFYELLLQLGGVCVSCGDSHLPSLTLDHVDGITWKRKALRYDARVGKYIREHAAGVRLRVLCGPCNSGDGARRLHDGDDYVPF